jgi:hypothetical protein
MINPHQAWRHYVHYSVFHETNYSSIPDVIIATMRLINDTFSQINFDYISVKYLGRYTPSRLKPLSRNWINIEKKIKEQRVENLVYGSTHPGGYDFQLGVAFSVSNERNRKVNTNLKGHSDHVSFWVSRWALQENVVSFQECNRLIKSIWRIVNGVYGSADYFISHLTGAVSDQARIAASKEFGARILTFEQISPNEDLHAEIPDIYWLNLLSWNHLKLLMDSGISKEDLSQFITDELAHKGVELQLAESPFTTKDQNFETSRTLLQAMLAPLLPE